MDIVETYKFTPPEDIVVDFNLLFEWTKHIDPNMTVEKFETLLKELEEKDETNI